MDGDGTDGCKPPSADYVYLLRHSQCLPEWRYAVLFCVNS